MNACPKCAAALPPEAVECPRCGVVLAKARPIAPPPLTLRANGSSSAGSPDRSSIPPPLPRTAPASPAASADAVDKARTLARVSWMMPFGVIAAGALLRRGDGSRAALFGIAAGGFLLYALGIVAALVALSRVSRVGRPGVLAPAIVGLSINALFVLIMAGVFVGNLVKGIGGAAGLTSAPQSAFGGRVSADLPCTPTDVPSEPEARVRRAHCAAGGMDFNLLLVDGSGPGAYNLERGAAGLVDKTHEAASDRGAGNWHDSRVNERHQEQPAVHVLESFDVKGSTYTIDAVLVSDGEDAWAIQIGRVAGDDAAERLVQSALASFAFTFD